MYKHQSNCYRIINGKRYENYSDLCFTEDENVKRITEAKKQFKSVRIMTRGDGLKAIFVKKTKTIKG